VQIGILIVTALIVVLIALAGQASSGLPAEVTVDKAYEMYQQGAFVLDVREQSEWDEYHAPNTTLIPLGELAARVSEVPKDKPVVVVCRSGNRSQEGRDILKQAGFTNITSMAGGLKTWRDKGYPIAP
jgi:rhodanese-related sulfurtransferase